MKTTADLLITAHDMGLEGALLPAGIWVSSRVLVRGSRAPQPPAQEAQGLCGRPPTWGGTSVQPIRVHGWLLSGDSFLNSAAWQGCSCGGTLTPKGPEEGSVAPMGLVIRRRAGSVLGHLLHSLEKLDGSRSLKQTMWQGRH